QTVQTTDAMPLNVSLFDGYSGEALNWQQLIDAIKWSQITILGEKHHNLPGDQFTQALLTDALGQKFISAVSLEMLYRDESQTVSEFNAGQIDINAFLDQTQRQGKKWEQSYAPMMRLAKNHQAPVIASNAPRSYVKMARQQGYDALRELPDVQQKLFELPLKLYDKSSNYQRFSAAIGGHPGMKLTPASIKAMYRSQRIWDATMADSMLKALAQHGSSVFHFIGQFHSDYDGGVVLSLLDRQPDVRLLTLSLQPGESSQLKPQDFQRADIVVYVGHAQPSE
ncbi:MAG: ChaN family lipoprotein, partial [Phycisphaeraceae bacterium JB051]